MILATHTGINNFIDPTCSLSGCCNDARDWNTRIPGKLLLNTGATLAKWQAAVSLQRSQLRSGDRWIITRSSHGTYTRDRNGDEADGRDEQFVYHDLSLLSDDLFAKFVMGRPANVPTLIFSDCCHGGTAHRLLPTFKKSRKVRYLPPAMISPKEYGKALLRDRISPRTVLEGVIYFGACADWDYAADAWFGNRSNGAFTYYAVRAFDIAKKKKATFRQMYEIIRDSLPNQEYTQTPTFHAPDDLAKMRVIDFFK
jgi:hypothetical protein